MSFAYSSPTLRRLQDRYGNGNFVFHGSGNPAIERFFPRVPKGVAFGADGDVFRCNPAVWASSNFETASVIAVARNSGPSEGLMAWQNMEIRDGCVSTAFSVASLCEPSELRAIFDDAAHGGDISSTVYVFERRSFTDEFPIPGEWLCFENVEPVDAVALTSQDVVELIDDVIPLSTLFVLNDAYIRRLSDSIVWSSGGHIQYDFSGNRLPKVEPTEAELDGVVDRLRIRTARFAKGYAWGTVVKAGDLRKSEGTANV